jgi:hypothetical protein
MLGTRSLSEDPFLLHDMEVGEAARLQRAKTLWWIWEPVTGPVDATADSVSLAIPP